MTDVMDEKVTSAAPEAAADNGTAESEEKPTTEQTGDNNENAPPSLDMKEKKPKSKKDVRRAFDEKRNEPVIIKRGVQGTVKWFSVDKGFGFIVRQDDGSDIFLHRSHIIRPQIAPGTRLYVAPRQNEMVEFDVVDGLVGPEAAAVTGIDGKLVNGGRPVRFRLRSRGASTQQRMGRNRVRSTNDNPPSPNEQGDTERKKKNRRRFASEGKPDASAGENTEEKSEKTGSRRRRREKGRGKKDKKSTGNGSNEKDNQEGEDNVTASEKLQAETEPIATAAVEKQNDECENEQNAVESTA